MLFKEFNNLILSLIIVQFLWLGILSFFLIKTLRHYYHLIGKTKKQNLKEILEEILAKIKEQEEKGRELEQWCREIEKKGLKHFQKIGFLRFNPFADTGGNQSFVLSLLDGEQNGFVLSSFHGREVTRIYAKTIKNGEGEGLKLSKEEKEAIKKALKK